MAQRNQKRFLRIRLLTEATPVLGSTAGIWDQALKGDLAKSLLDVRQRVMALRDQDNPENISHSP